MVETTLRNTSSDLASAIELFDDVIPEEYHVDVGSPFGDMMHELKIQMVLRHYETTATSSARKTQTRFPGIEELFRGIGLPPSEVCLSSCSNGPLLRTTLLQTLDPCCMPA